MGEQLLAHSPLGASGASRWMPCPGSVSLSEGIIEEESEYAKEGTAAHTLGEICLSRKVEPWAFIGYDVWEGQTWHVPTVEFGPNDGVHITKDMADAVQSYLDLINEWHPERHQGNSWIERKFHCPDIHKLFYGTADFVYLDEAYALVDNDTGEITEVKALHVWDYKHGAGIVIEAKGNPQCLYYAAGILEDLRMWNEVEVVVIHIVQPRGWHFDGPHRTWEVTTDYLDEWLFDELVPAMDKTMISRDINYGSHCRFCPARTHACPALMGAVEELQELMVMVSDKIKGETKKAKEASATEAARELTPPQLGRLIDLQEIAKIVFKAANTTAYGRLSAGGEVPGVKLVKARTNREYKDKESAETAAKKEFGKRCLTKPTFMSPNVLDGLPGGKAFTARWAFKPEGKLTVASDGDPRRRVNRNAKSLFTKKGK